MIGETAHVPGYQAQVGGYGRRSGNGQVVRCQVRAFARDAPARNFQQ
jgi:hypothetical protein